MFSSFDIVPYVSVGPLRLGMTRAELHSILGKPDTTKKSKFGPKVVDRWRAEDLTVTLSSETGSVEEIGFGSAQRLAQVNGIRLFAQDGPHAYRDLCLADGGARHDVGFTVLFKLGVTLSGFDVTAQDDRTVTVFAKGVWDENDQRLKPAAV
jgi:hypothetical protein